MSYAEWKWFKNGYQTDIKCKAININGELSYPSITIFTECKDKQDARRSAIEELSKYGYTKIEVCKLVQRF